MAFPNRTWVQGELVTAVIMNAAVRDNLDQTAGAVVTSVDDLVVGTGSNTVGRKGAPQTTAATYGATGFAVFTHQRNAAGTGTELDWATADDLVLDTSGNVEIKDAAVTTAKINDGAVTTAKVGDAQITKAKLNADIGNIVTDLDLGPHADDVWADWVSLWSSLTDRRGVFTLYSATVESDANIYRPNTIVDDSTAAISIGQMPYDNNPADFNSTQTYDTLDVADYTGGTVLYLIDTRASHPASAYVKITLSANTAVMGTGNAAYITAECAVDVVGTLPAGWVTTRISKTAPSNTAIEIPFSALVGQAASGQIAANAITTAKVANDAITRDKIADAVRTYASGTSLPSNPALGDTYLLTQDAGGSTEGWYICVTAGEWEATGAAPNEKSASKNTDTALTAVSTDIVSVAITPRKSTNQVEVRGSAPNQSVLIPPELNVYRGTTLLGDVRTSSLILDSPNSTSEQTYTIKAEEPEVFAVYRQGVGSLGVYDVLGADASGFASSVTVLPVLSGTETYGLGMCYNPDEDAFQFVTGEFGNAPVRGINPSDKARKTAADFNTSDIVNTSDRWSNILYNNGRVYLLCFNGSNTNYILRAFHSTTGARTSSDDITLTGYTGGVVGFWNWENERLYLGKGTAPVGTYTFEAYNRGSRDSSKDITLPAHANSWIIDRSVFYSDWHGFINTRGTSYNAGDTPYRQLNTQLSTLMLSGTFPTSIVTIPRGSVKQPVQLVVREVGT